MAEPSSSRGSPADAVDMLVVGGGPAGTAAAFRAVELGRSVLVLDRRRALSVLADWAESGKAVDADYKRCRGFAFPTGGALIGTLPFEDQTEATRLYERWHAIYREHVPHRDGIELVRIDRASDGTLAVLCHAVPGKEEVRFHPRTVLLAIGLAAAKVELLGDGGPIQYHLRSPNDFVGHPACVYGGGMSAAEAAVAIAHAKTRANDHSEVYWCYHRRDLRNVREGDALAKRFFDVFTYGNIRYQPYSKLFAGFRGEDGEQMVAVRVRQQRAEHAPAEVTCLEFKSSQVLACIGAERPEDLLESLGISTFHSADAPQKRRLALTPMYESQVAGVFVAGSLLDPAYIETTDFRPDALQSNVREHPGCFKTAILDGVLAAEAIDGRLAGLGEAEIVRGLVRRRQELHAKRAADSSPARSRPIVPPAPAAAAPKARAAFLLPGPTDTAERREIFLDQGETLVGRTIAGVPFSADPSVREPHVVLRVEGEECYVSNDEHGGLCHVRFKAERTFSQGEILCVGDQRLQVVQSNGRLALAVCSTGAVIPIGPAEVTLGRDHIAPDDRRVSRAHFSIADLGDVVRVRNSGRNGTYIELQGTQRLNEDDEVWIAGERLRFLGMRIANVAPAQVVTGTRRTPAADPDTERRVVLSDGRQIEVDGDQPLLALLFRDGRATDKPTDVAGEVRTLWECWDPGEPLESGGTCGKCALTIEEGMANLVDAGTPEMNTLKRKRDALWRGKIDVARCRLACQARVRAGTVRITQNGKPPSM